MTECKFLVLNARLGLKFLACFIVGTQISCTGSIKLDKKETEKESKSLPLEKAQEISIRAYDPKMGQKVWVGTFNPNRSITYPECWKMDSILSAGQQELVSFSPTSSCPKSSLGLWNITYGTLGDVFLKRYLPKRRQQKASINGVDTIFLELEDYSDPNLPTWEVYYSCGSGQVKVNYFRDKKVEPRKHEIPDILKLMLVGFRCKK